MAQSQWGQLYNQGVNQFRNSYNVITYGALILPYEDALGTPNNETITKNSNKTKGKFTTALKKAGTNIKNGILHPVQTIKDLSKFINENTDLLSDKLSGIAIAQLIMDGKVTSQEALDYLFLGFAPALGITARALGYSGLNEMKNALKSDNMNVGSFINGFSTTLKSAKQIKEQITKRNTQNRGDVIQFDLTISHGENYTSETPDRRVQNGQSLQEYIHNLPETFDIQCALQEGKRYSKAEFREIMSVIRKRKDVVTLILGEEMFLPVVLTGFNPNSDCTKSGFDYSLSFKQVYQSNIDTNKEVTIQKIPIDKLKKDLQSSSSIGSGNNIGSLGGSPSNISDPFSPENIAQDSKKMKKAIIAYAREIWDAVPTLHDAYDSFSNYAAEKLREKGY